MAADSFAGDSGRTIEAMTLARPRSRVIRDGSMHRMDDRTRRALAVDRAFLALGHETFAAAGARFVRDLGVPAIHDANSVTDVTATTPEEIERLLARVEREFAGVRHRQFLLDTATPPAVEAALVLRGYEHSASLVLLLDGAPGGVPRSHDVCPVADEAGWAAYARLKQRDWDERAARRGLRDVAHVGAQMVRQHRAKSPPAQYWLAWLDGVPRGYLASWPGIDAVGQVEDLYVEPEVRHRGLATALIHRGVADCRARGADGVVIVAEADDTPKAMYAAMGFRPLAVVHKYLLRLDD
jgi:ribosomal protein S18 acetylase RimI-like enzyme